jgi:hypothetical protein
MFAETCEKKGSEKDKTNYRANAFESQYTKERAMTAYNSFQPTETCA